MNIKRPRTKLAGKIDMANRKQMAKGRESKKRDGLGHPSTRVHPIGELTSQYGAAENELERVGAPKLY
ncbi:MAG: hypothetical protein ACYCPP_05645 [Nitrososphaerales archaeon]